ncbi:hypothetical protein KKA14_15560 [bacterium]|nr:hypothetical protein [bacterium]
MKDYIIITVTGEKYKHTSEIGLNIESDSVLGRVVVVEDKDKTIKVAIDKIVSISSGTAEKK